MIQWLYATNSWCGVYRVDPDAVIIGDVFAKKTRATPPAVFANCKRRFRDYDLATKEE